MKFRIGRLNLPSEEYFNELIRKGILAIHDVSPIARIKHDNYIRKKYGRLTETEMKTLHLASTDKSKKNFRPLRDEEEVVNPWL